VIIDGTQIAKELLAKRFCGSEVMNE